MNEKLPCDKCKGRCCTFPAMTKREFKNIRKKHGVPKGTQKMEFNFGVMLHKKDSDECPWLLDGKCSVYDDRPLNCKLYGNVKSMPCQYLYPEQAEQSFNKVAKRLGILDGKGRV